MVVAAKFVKAELLLPTLECKCSVPSILPHPFLAHCTELGCFNENIKYVKLKEKERQTCILLLDTGTQVTTVSTVAGTLLSIRGTK